MSRESIDRHPHQEYMALQAHDVSPPAMVSLLHDLRAYDGIDVYGRFCHAEAALELATETRNPAISRNLLNEADEQYAAASTVAQQTGRDVIGLKIAMRHQFLPRYRQVYEEGKQATDPIVEQQLWHGLVDTLDSHDVSSLAEQSGNVALTEIVFHALIARNNAKRTDSNTIQTWPSFLRQATRTRGGSDKNVWNASMTAARREDIRKLRVVPISSTGRDRSISAQDFFRLPRIGLVEALRITDQDGIVRVAHAMQQERNHDQVGHGRRYVSDAEQVLSAKVDRHGTALTSLLGRIAQM